MSQNSPRPSAPNKTFVRKDSARWKRNGWTSTPNSILHDPDISPEECWAWSWLASHTQTFELNGESLWHAKTSLSKNKSYELIKRLEERGLLLRLYEVDDRGIPYTVYELQPEPVPEEERTARPRKQTTTKQTSKPKSRNTAPTKRQGKSGSRTVGKSGLRSENDTASPVGDFPEGREIGTAQRKQGEHSDGETGGDLPDRPGRSPGDTSLQVSADSENRESAVFPAQSDLPDRPGRSYKEEKTKEKDQPTTGDEPASGSEDYDSATPGWLEHVTEENRQAGERLLRSLPRGVGEKIASSAVTRWAPMVGAALQAGTASSVIVDKLTDGLPNDGGAGRRVKIVVGYRLPDLEAIVRNTEPQPVHAAPEVNDTIDQWSVLGVHGARRAAGVLGIVWDPEDYRDGEDTQTWMLEVRPRLAREFIEQHRDELAATLGGAAA